MPRAVFAVVITSWFFYFSPHLGFHFLALLNQSIWLTTNPWSEGGVVLILDFMTLFLLSNRVAKDQHRAQNSSSSNSVQPRVQLRATLMWKHNKNSQSLTQGITWRQKGSLDQPGAAASMETGRRNRENTGLFLGNIPLWALVWT